MKQIKLKCLRDGGVILVEKTLIFNAENQATEFIVDYTNTTAEGLFKHVEVLVGTDLTTRVFNLGTDDIVSFTIKQDITKGGYIYIQPYAIESGIDTDFKKVYFHKSQLQVRASINALNSDTSYTPPIAEQFQIELDLLVARIIALENKTLADFEHGGV